MPATLDAFLAERARDLAPSSAQREAASRSQNFIRDLLNTGHMGKRIVDSYLIGSYARHTALHPLDDVDIVFVIDPSAWQSLLGKWLGVLPHPEKLLQSFARAIRDRYEGSTVRVQTRSVGLKMHHLDIDAVPAVAHPKNPDWIRIPCRRTAGWIATAPKIHSAEATAINKRLGGRFLPLVRLLKAWNEGQPSATSLKGFAVETLAVKLFSSVSYSSLVEGLSLFFDFVTWCGNLKAKQMWTNLYGISFSWPRKLSDTANTGQNLFSAVESDRVERFAESARVVRDVIDKAQRARTSDAGWDYLDNRFPL
ncbi:MAG: nucleotidyltransferase [Deltaproteobacteria bacterium]|nr:MAG: nucleotidyltransferase [Deltaproteobacteria bacterium]TMQ11039.1 MAG: nucleotidyltransferase [Deltaproteobacteria bacterium]